MDTIGKGVLKKIANFGGNQQWYSDCYRPQSVAEVLEILQQNPRATIRALGSGHSWSDVAANTDIALEMSAFSSVDLIVVDGEQLVRAGAGCTLQDLLDRLHASVSDAQAAAVLTTPVVAASCRRMAGCRIART